nr:MAG TPA: hypothetical protein [Caudoviricetes sp.]
MSCNYPMMSQGQLNSAPWNEKEQSVITRDCEITETVTRKVTLATTDYSADSDYDDEFGACSSVDTSETNWVAEYDEQEYSIIELLSKLKKYVADDLRNTKHSLRQRKDLQKLLLVCDSWKQEDVCVEEV